MYAEIKMPDGKYAFHDGKEWVCFERDHKTVVEYFSKRLPPGNYPDLLEATIRHVVASMVGAELVLFDRERVADVSKMPSFMRKWYQRFRVK